MPDDVDLAVRIRYWMDRAGLNGVQLAEAIGVSPPTVYNWRNGERGATLSNVAAIADACGVTVSEFWGPISAAEIKRLRGEAA